MVRLGGVCLACALFTGCAPRAVNAVAAPTVEVEWNGSWWPAVLRERRGSAWLIHYDGYDDAWDEVVDTDRIRDRRPKDPDDEPVMLPDDEDAP